VQVGPTSSSRSVKSVTSITSPTSITASPSSPPVWEQGYANAGNPYYETNLDEWTSSEEVATRYMCGKIWSSWFYSWMATVDTSTFNPPFQTTLQYMTSEGLTIAKEWDTPDTTIISIWQTVEVGSTFLTNAVPQGTTGNADFTASPPCCRMCSFSLGAIQVYHWPTTGPPAAPTLTNSVGYTL
jgi:hypothetical protein